MNSRKKQEFEQKISKENIEKRVDNHEITGGKFSRQAENALKLCRVFHEHGNPFESLDEDELTNLLGKPIASDSMTHDILQRDHIGQKMFLDFVKNVSETGNFLFE